MNQLLDKALKAVRQLPEDAQTEIARLMLDVARKDEAETIDPRHLPSVERGLDQHRRGDYASNEATAAALKRFEP